MIFICIQYIGFKRRNLDFIKIKSWINENRWMSTYFGLFLLYNGITIVIPLIHIILFFIDKLSLFYLAFISDGPQVGISFFLNSLSPNRVNFIYKLGSIFQQYKFILIQGLLAVVGSFIILSVSIWYGLKKKWIETKIIYWGLGGVFFSGFILFKNISDFIQLIRGNLMSIFLILIDFFDMFSSWHYPLFSYQFLMTSIHTFFGHEVKSVLIRAYPTYMSSLVIVVMISILIVGILKHWKSCWTDYQLASFIDRNKKYVMICGLFFFLISFKLSLLIFPLYYCNNFFNLAYQKRYR